MNNTSQYDLFFTFYLLLAGLAKNLEWDWNVFSK